MHVCKEESTQRKAERKDDLNVCSRSHSHSHSQSCSGDNRSKPKHGSDLLSAPAPAPIASQQPAMSFQEKWRRMRATLVESAKEKKDEVRQARYRCLGF
jgi:hypothetical protein